MNLIVGSHTFTELPGVRSLAHKLQERRPALEVVRILETHYETMPDKAAHWRF